MKSAKKSIKSDESASLIVKAGKPLSIIMIGLCVFILSYIIFFTPKYDPDLSLYPARSMTPGIYELENRLTSKINHPQIKAAYLLFKQKRFEEAKEALNHLSNIIHDENKKYIYFLLGEIEYINKNFEGALAFYDRALLFDARFFECIIKRGMTSSKLGNTDDAIMYLLRAREIKRKSFFVNFELGKIYYSLGKNNRALFHFNVCLDVASDIRALFYKAKTLLKSDKIKEALKIFKDIASSETDIIYRRPAVYELYTHYFNTGNLDAALKYLHIWKSFDASNGDVFLELGKLYYLKKLYKEADSMFEEAFEKLIEKDKVLIFIAMSKIALKKYDEALRYIKRYLKTGLQNYKIYRLAGDAYFGLNNFKKSLENYNIYLEKTNQSSIDKEIYLRVAKVYDALGDYDKAIEHLKKCLKSPDIPKEDVYFNLAVVYDHKGEHEKSLDYLTKTLKITSGPKREEIISYIGDIYVKLRRFNEAIDFYNRILAENPENKTASFKLGNAYFTSGDFNKSKSYFANIIRYKDTQGSDNKIISLTYMRLGDIDNIEQNYLKAISSYKKSYKYDSTNYPAKIRLARMYLYNFMYDKCEKELAGLLSSVNSKYLRSKIYYLLASLRHKQGFRKRAIEYIKKSLSENPYNDEARILARSLD
jgi:tetratricopeptide (TPR) repeat protein